MNTKKVNVQMLEPQPTNGIRTIDITSSQTIAKPIVGNGTVEVEAPYFDKNGVEIKEFAVIKVFHFIGRRKKRHYMYKWVRLVEDKGKKYWYGQHLEDASGFFENPKNKWSGYRLGYNANSERKILDTEVVQQSDL